MIDHTRPIAGRDATWHCETMKQNGCAECDVRESNSPFHGTASGPQRDVLTTGRTSPLIPHFSWRRSNMAGWFKYLLSCSGESPLDAWSHIKNHYLAFSSVLVATIYFLRATTPEVLIMHRLLDYTDDSHVSYATRAPAPSSHAVLTSHSAPPGFPSGVSSRDVQHFNQLVARTNNREKDCKARVKNAYKHSWRMAFQPGRALVTSAFALFMTGASIHVFSVMTCITVLFLQVQALTSAFGVFAGMVKDEPALKGRLLPQFFVHVSLCLLGVAGALYQCQRIGFLPTTESDWIGLLPLQRLADRPVYAGGFAI